MNGDGSKPGSLQATYETGIETEAPYVPKWGIILIWVVLRLQLFCLLALSLYCAWVPRWTNQLDVFAMIDLGASLADDLPFLMAQDSEKIHALYNLPGWIGDIVEKGTDKREKDVVGKLTLGGDITFNQAT